MFSFSTLTTVVQLEELRGFFEDLPQISDVNNIALVKSVDITESAAILYDRMLALLSHRECLLLAIILEATTKL